MSTRSRIGLTRPNGSIISIYCHSDGYLEGPHGVGHTLLNHYQDRKKITALIKLGDISCLQEHVAPPVGVEHSYDHDKLAPNVTVAYMRDRGETGCGAQIHKNVDEFLTFDSGQEYSYLFASATGWTVWAHDAPTRLLGPLATAHVTERLTA